MALAIARCAKYLHTKLNGIPPQHISAMMRRILEDAGYIKRRANRRPGVNRRGNDDRSAPKQSTP